MSDLETELAALRERLVFLEEQKRKKEALELERQKFPLKIIEDFIESKKKDIATPNMYDKKNYPLALYYDLEKMHFLEPILKVLKQFQERLDALEKKQMIDSI